VAARQDDFADDDALLDYFGAIGKGAGDGRTAAVSVRQDTSRAKIIDDAARDCEASSETRIDDHDRSVLAPLAVAVAVRLFPYRHADGGSRLFSLNRRRGRVIKMSVPRLQSRLLHLVLVRRFLSVAKVT
jgi:hypothetical protein